MGFSTYDQDNDNNANMNCAQMYGGGWWYNDCSGTSLNGDFPTTMIWSSPEFLAFNPVTSCEMMIKEISSPDSGQP